MPLLAAFLLNAFTALITFFTTYVGKKLAMGTAAIAFFAGLFLAFFAVIEGMVTTVQYTIADSWLATALAMLWPAHLSVCIGVCFSATIAKWVYAETMERAKVFLYIT